MDNDYDKDKDIVILFKRTGHLRIMTLVKTRILCSRGHLEHDIDEDKDFDILLKRTHGWMEMRTDRRTVARTETQSERRTETRAEALM